MKFLTKIPRLSDRYFQSRPISDMAERSHSLHLLRVLPQLTANLLQAALRLVAVAAALCWLDSAVAPVAALAVAISIGLPLAFSTWLQEQGLRVQTHAGALGRFHLDALLGLTAMRAHGAERAIQREHEGLLTEWARASRRLLFSSSTMTACQALAGFAMAGWLMFDHASRAQGSSAALLFAYWSVSLPLLGAEAARLVAQWPHHRSVALRALEPLGTPEEPEASCEASPASTGGVSLELQSVSVLASGHTILSDFTLSIAPGSHVAILGPSGAGKSTFAGLFLGWHRPSAGQILVDGSPLGAAGLDRLRQQTAWLDPAVTLWNRSLLENLRLGTGEEGSASIAAALEEADLLEVVERLPEGLQTSLGEGGRLVSGGEGQRVRFARILSKAGQRLVILDEPFRGLDRDVRRHLAARARRRWKEATLLFITHDIHETRSFERVIVIDGGRIVEDGSPAALSSDSDSRYRRLLDAETAAQLKVWSDVPWRHVGLDAGRLSEPPRRDTP